jgi:hypothetical protein
MIIFKRKYFQYFVLYLIYFNCNAAELLIFILILYFNSWQKFIQQSSPLVKIKDTRPPRSRLTQKKSDNQELKEDSAKELKLSDKSSAKSLESLLTKRESSNY